ncbi:MAG: hypothetical protein Q8M31_04040 [Beijerinckiaceae bacterium]|nr:hypothetical protein [Beijerinckiaceae bacterium]
MANVPNTTSRRAVIAGLALSTVAALPAAAVSQPDPIFATIADERKALAKWQTLCEEFERVQAAWYEVSDAFPEHVIVGLDGCLTGEGEGGFRFSDPLKLKAWGVRSTERFFAFDEDAQRRLRRKRVAARLELRKRLRTAAAEEKKRGLPELEAAADAALYAWQDYEWEVMETLPTTNEGAVALVNFAREYIREHSGQAEEADRALETLGAFLSQGGANV